MPSRGAGTRTWSLGCRSRHGPSSQAPGRRKPADRLADHQQGGQEKHRAKEMPKAGCLAERPGTTSGNGS
jgi:hypothetical protein